MENGALFQENFPFL